MMLMYLFIIFSKLINIQFRGAPLLSLSPPFNIKLRHLSTSYLQTNGAL